MAKRIKHLEQKLKHNCPSCQATYTLLETHLTKKDSQCHTNCKKLWEKTLIKFCQEKVLGSELAEGQEEQNKENHGNNR